MPKSQYLLPIAACVVICFLTLASMFSVYNHQKSTDLTPNMVKRIRQLTQTACAEASKAKQDSNPIMAFMHSCTAKAYLDACVHLSGTNLETLTQLAGDGIGEDVRIQLSNIIQKNMQTITSRYPALSIKGAERFALGAGWVA